MSIPTVDPVGVLLPEARDLASGPLPPVRPRYRQVAPTRAHVTTVAGTPNVGLDLPEPGSKVQTFVPNPALANSPALLVDYTAWVRDFDAVRERNTASGAYRDMVVKIYEHALGQSGSERWYADLNAKLAELRRHLCSGDAPICTLPETVHDAAGLQVIADVLVEPRTLDAMRTRWGVNVHPVTFLNSPRQFDLIMTRREQTEERSDQFWNMPRHPVSTIYATTVHRGVDGYQASVEGGSFAGLFAMGREGVVIDDWLLRDRAMAFANVWKRSVDIAGGEPLANPIGDANDIVYRAMRRETGTELEAAYQRLLPLTVSDAEVRARFERERAAGDYPAEVYQHVAYAHLREMLRLQSSFYVSALAEHPETSPRQLALQSLLTLQRYAPAWRFFLMELSTQATPIFARAAVIDQMADPLLAITFVLEQMKAVLGDDVYAADALYDRFRYAVMADELFDARYLREYQPAMYQELLQADGSLRRVSQLPRDQQISLLRRYLVTPDGRTSASGIVRLRSVFASRVREDDLRFLAQVIYQRRVASQ